MPSIENRKCPIPGCNMHYAAGVTGWARHVGSMPNHPYWHPAATEAAVRRELFTAEFGDAFFAGTRARTSSRPPPRAPALPPIPPPLDNSNVDALTRAVRQAIYDGFIAALGEGSVPKVRT